MGFRYQDTQEQKKIAQPVRSRHSFRRQVPAKDFYSFFSQLSAYYQTSYFSFDDAFKTMAEEDFHPKLQQALIEMRRDLKESIPLSEIFAQQEIFPKYCASIIAAGEKTGVLDKLLEEIGKHIKQDGDVQDSIKSSLLLPKIVFTFLTIAMAIIFTQVIPRYQEIYRQMKIDLPLLTQMVFGVYTFCRNHWVLVLMGLAGVLGYGSYFFRKKPDQVDWLKLRIPLYKNLYRKMLQYRFCKSLGMFLEAGAGAQEALQYTGDAMDNAVARRAMYRAAEKILDGFPLAETIKECNREGIIDRMPIDYITGGEKTGRIPELLKKSADHYMAEAEMETKDFSVRVSAALLVPTAAFELLILLSILLPSYSMVLGAQ